MVLLAVEQTKASAALTWWCRLLKPSCNIRTTDDSFTLFQKLFFHAVFLHVIYGNFQNYHLKSMRTINQPSYIIWGRLTEISISKTQQLHKLVLVGNRLIVSWTDRHLLSEEPTPICDGTYEVLTLMEKYTPYTHVFMVHALLQDFLVILKHVSEEMFLLYHMHIEKVGMFKSSTIHCCMTRHKKVKI